MNVNRLYTLVCLLAFCVLCVALPTAAQSTAVPCEDGTAAGFACHNVDLVAWLPLDQIGGDPANGVFASDNWGWQSPDTSKEYMLVGLRDGTSMIDVTDPAAPLYLGKLPSQAAGLSDYRDIKVYENHAFIIGDQPYTDHGMQVFDLTQLDTVTQTTTFTSTAVYTGVGYGHNMWINEATGYAYIFRSDTCEAGEHIVDIRNPLAPTFAGCATINGGSSDAECVIYDGPDSDYTGQEICFVGSDSTAGISDVTDKNNPITIADFTYPNIARAHQGTLTPDKNYWLISDTMDEMMHGLNTSTVIIDVRDLDNPQYVRTVDLGTTARDHNIYFAPDGTLMMTNWRAGFRHYDVSDFDNWVELGYFDTYPADDGLAVKSGSWSHYDHLSSGVIAVSDVESGLFLLRPTGQPTAVTLSHTAAHTALPWAMLALAGLTLCLATRRQQQTR